MARSDSQSVYSASIPQIVSYHAKDERLVSIRRQWNDWRVAKVVFSDLSRFHWSRVSGSVRSTEIQPFVHAYVGCDRIQGDIAHSCLHGEGPHQINVCLEKRDNDSMIWKEILAIAGPKPGR